MKGIFRNIVPGVSPKISVVPGFSLVRLMLAENRFRHCEALRGTKQTATAISTLKRAYGPEGSHCIKTTPGKFGSKVNPVLNPGLKCTLFYPENI